jgi:PAS domain S-box-containing protein
MFDRSDIGEVLSFGPGMRSVADADSLNKRGLFDADGLRPATGARMRDFLIAVVGMLPIALFGGWKVRGYLKAGSARNQFLSAFIENLPFVVYAKDRSGRYILANSQFCSMLGLERSQIIGKTDPEVLPSEMLRACNESDRSVLQLGEVVVQEKYPRVQGGVVIFETRKYAVRDKSGQIYAICGISTNVSDREQAEQVIAEHQIMMVASSKMSALGEMSGGIAHEINNPLAIILNSASQLKELVESRELDPVYIGQAVGRIEVTAKRIAKIILGLRNFSRESGNDPLENIPVSLIVNETLELCKERFKSHGVELHAGDIAPTFTIDCRSTQISQVLLNLLNNAFDAVEGLNEKWVKIECAESNGCLILSVTDSGNGVAAELREKIMQPFFTTKEVGKGTGLGLSIAKGIIEGHRGTLRYDEQSKNTRFVVILPKVEMASAA